MKKLILIILFIGAAFGANAGGLLTNTNQSVAFLRNMARGTSLSPDAVYFNPAGTAFFDKGWYIGINVQQATQRRITYSSFAPFAMNANGNGTQDRDVVGKAFSPVIPSIHRGWKRERVALMGSFAVGGGGGSATYNNGLASFESLVAQIPVLLQNYGLPTSQYSADMYIKGTTYTFAFQVGAAFKFTDWLSAALQIRANFAYQRYEGYLHNIMINPQHPLLNPTGALMPASKFFEMAAQAYPAFEEFVALTSDKDLHTVQRGVAITPVISLCFMKDGWMASAKYEAKSHMKLKNHTTKDVQFTGDSMFPDGAETEADIPAILSLAASRQLGPIKLAAQWNHYFDKDAKNSFSETVTGDTNEYIFGTEWDITKRFLAGTSVQITKKRLDPLKYSDMGFDCSSVSWGLGVSYQISKKLRLNASWMKTFYDKVTENAPTYNGNLAGLPGTNVYYRKSMCYGVGIDITL